MSNKEDAIERAHQWVQATIKNYDRSIELIHEIPDDMPGTISANIVGVQVHIPRDLDTLRRVRRCIARMNGFERKGEEENKHGTIYLTYVRRNPDYQEIEVVMVLSGSNCRRVKVGEETVVQDVYQVICE